MKLSNLHLVVLYFLAVGGLAYLCWSTLTGGGSPAQFELRAHRAARVVMLQQGLSADQCAQALEAARISLPSDIALSCD